MPVDVTLRMTEKNEVLPLINDLGFDPADFEWSEIEQTETRRRSANRFRVSVLTHSRSGYSGVFGGIYLRISPGPNQKVEAHEHMGAWPFKLSYCRFWLQELRKEVDAPDLWASVREERAFSDAASSTSANNPFTPSERNDIATQLDELKQ